MEKNEGVDPEEARLMYERRQQKTRETSTDEISNKNEKEEKCSKCTLAEKAVVELQRKCEILERVIRELQKKNENSPSEKEKEKTKETNESMEESGKNKKEANEPNKRIEETTSEEGIHEQPENGREETNSDIEVPDETKGEKTKEVNEPIRISGLKKPIVAGTSSDEDEVDDEFGSEQESDFTLGSSEIGDSDKELRDEMEKIAEILIAKRNWSQRSPKS